MQMIRRRWAYIPWNLIYLIFILPFVFVNQWLAIFVSINVTLAMARWKLFLNFYGFYTSINIFIHLCPAYSIVIQYE